MKVGRRRKVLGERGKEGEGAVRRDVDLLWELSILCAKILS